MNIMRRCLTAILRLFARPTRTGAATDHWARGL
jgi:hypothetical protein